METIFIGTAGFAVPALRSLIKEHQVDLVVTQPDRPSGRSMEPSQSSVKEEALELDLPVFQPENINSKESLKKVDKIEPDAFVLAAYGQKISGKFLDLVDWPVNLHGSLLPKYRGAAPINWAIIRGEKITGVTTILMDEGLDSGPILLKERTEIKENETAGQLHDRLAEMGGNLILKTLAGLEEGSVEPTPQKGEPSFAPKLNREDGLLDWNQPSLDVHNHIRGSYPWPGAYTYLGKQKEQKIKICCSRNLGELKEELLMKLPMREKSKRAETGEIIDSGSLGLVVKCGDNTAVKLTKVKPSSRGEMGGTDFVNGYHIEIGDKFVKPQ
ncbi:methionyl-tRNA formyltransferase [Candidatus Bipolaricaulota bacterium]|nr:methionyl-tRNA formyltransferase [Candidatus Bipolaricaulota bacterium]